MDYIMEKAKRLQKLLLMTATTDDARTEEALFHITKFIGSVESGNKDV